MYVRGPSNVEKAAKMAPTLLCYFAVITEQKKCWEFLVQKFDRFETLRNNCANKCNMWISNNVESC